VTSESDLLKISGDGVYLITLWQNLHFACSWHDGFRRYYASKKSSARLKPISHNCASGPHCPLVRTMDVCGAAAPLACTNQLKLPKLKSAGHDSRKPVT